MKRGLYYLTDSKFIYYISSTPLTIEGIKDIRKETISSFKNNWNYICLDILSESFKDLEYLKEIKSQVEDIVGKKLEIVEVGFELNKIKY